MVIDYIDAPEIETFHFEFDEERGIESLPRWIATFSERNQASISYLSILPTRHESVTTIAFWPNFRITTVTGSSPEDNNETWELVHHIHDSVSPEITSLDVHITGPALVQFITALATRFTAVSELDVGSDHLALLTFLGQPRASGDWPFSQMKVLRFDNVSNAYNPSAPLRDLLSVRCSRDNNGFTPLEKVHIKDGVLSRSFLDAVRELGMPVETSSRAILI